MRSWTWLLACALSSVLIACAGRSDVEVELSLLDAGTEGGLVDAGSVDAPKPSRTDNVDLLLVVDNSRSLETAQGLLVDTLPYLLDRFIRPACVNGLGTVVAETPSIDDPCPVGVRDFAPVTDLHIGVISTSIGGHGADTCSPNSQNFVAMQNDRARLLARDTTGNAVPTWGNKGFLVWDPSQAASPPGDVDPNVFGDKLAAMVAGVGTKGCGFEAQLESIYRFLIDPKPYMDIVVKDGKATPIGVDDVLLQQRRDFVRPNSLVAVLLLSDENDCSTRDGGQYYLVNQGIGADNKAFRMPRARSICEDKPYDPCCVSCAQPAPAGCTPPETDPACQTFYTATEDALNLRCFDQKRRFGIDFLYPPSRYIEAFTSETIGTREGDVVPNPLFAAGRPTNFFVFGGIVGVPWQDIAVDPSSLSTGFRPPSQIDWSLVIGDRLTDEPPIDPLMIESIDPRQGVHPLTGTSLAPPTSTSAKAHPINGHERMIDKRDDLQYACIYPLRVPVDCADKPECECATDFETNPVCQAPDGSYSTVQHFSRALPATRQLEVMRAMGDQAAVASICAPHVTSTALPTFGYKPAVDALLRALRWRLEPAPKS